MRIALVLGSGGAKGYAHIGVIDELKARGHEIAVVSGSSMGAVVGGLEAAGALDDFRDWACSLSYLDVLRYMDIALGRGGVLKAERIVSRIAELCDNANIEDFPFPYTAVATDITARREVWFQRGPFASAIRASIAVPGVIAPVLLGDHLLVDGGVLNPVPVEPTLGVPTDVTIAVSLNGRDSLHEVQLLADAANVESIDEDADDSPLARRIGEKVAGFFSRGSADKDENSGDALAESEARPDAASLADVVAVADSVDALEATGGGDTEEIVEAGPVLSDGRASIVDVMEMSLNAMEDRMERVRKAISPAHVHIEIPADVCSTWDFYRAEEVIEVGRECARRVFDRFGL